jgi:MFS family permease
LENDYPEILRNGTLAPTFQGLFGASYFGGLCFGTVTPLILGVLGFKFTMIVSTLVGLFGQLISVFSAHYFVLCIGRFIIGLGVGVTTVVGTVYSGSMAHEFFLKWKGFIGTFFLVGLTSNVLLANVSVFTAKIVLSWRWMMLIGFIPNISLLILGIVMPESPMWRTGDKKQNLGILMQLKKLFFEFKNLSRMILCCVLIFSFMLGGTVPVINYLPYTLRIAGIEDFYILAGASISVAFVNLVTALGTSLFINLVSRRTLLGFGYCVMFTATMSLALVIHFVEAPTSGYIAIALSMLFLVGNNGGVNSIIFFIFNELFETDVALVASSLLFTFFNFVRFVMNFAYIPIETSMGLPGVLLMCSCFICITAIILMLYLPETNLKFVWNTKPQDEEKEILTEINVELENNSKKENEIFNFQPENHVKEFQPMDENVKDVDAME